MFLGESVDFQVKIDERPLLVARASRRCAPGSAIRSTCRWIREKCVALQGNRPNDRSAKRLKRWASDVIVDLLHAYELPYAALNPGASYRGLHDSLVNYGGNRPAMMLCQHEETAVQIAHGYAKASGKPMVAILHNLVGLLHANMAIYYAYIDRAPVFIIGATGPMDETKRRPRIDWIHTAQVQGEAVRDYTKWDYQPHAHRRRARIVRARLLGDDDRAARADLHVLRRVAAGAAARARGAAAAGTTRPRCRRRMAPDPAALAEGRGDAARGRSGRSSSPSSSAAIPRASTRWWSSPRRSASPVYDVNSRLNFPSRHPLNLSMAKDVFRDADLVLCLDTRDWERPTTRARQHHARGDLDRARRARSGSTSASATSSSRAGRWTTSACAHADLRILADTTLAIPALDASFSKPGLRKDAALARSGQGARPR